MSSRFILAKFDELTPSQVEAIFRLRQNVFIIEQSCFYEDIDGSDSHASHLLYMVENNLAGYLRIFEPGLVFQNEVAIGRIVVEPSYRGLDIGKIVINTGIEHAQDRYPNKTIKIEAQAALVTYYIQFGFNPIGHVYNVDDIPHQLMVL